MKKIEKKYIVYYYHHSTSGHSVATTTLGHSVVAAHSPAEAKDIMGKRLKGKGHEEYGIDGVLDMAKESEMNETRFYAL